MGRRPVHIFFFHERAKNEKQVHKRCPAVTNQEGNTNPKLNQLTLLRKSLKQNQHG